MIILKRRIGEIEEIWRIQLKEIKGQKLEYDQNQSDV